MTPENYVHTVGARLEAGGFEISRPDLPGGTALVGFRSEFRWRWLATKVNESLDYGVRQKGRGRGLQADVAVIPGLVAQEPEDATVYAATENLITRFAAFAWPTLVDCTAHQVYRNDGPVVAGRPYATWMRHQIAEPFPEPWETRS